MLIWTYWIEGSRCSVLKAARHHPRSVVEIGVTRRQRRTEHGLGLMGLRTGLLRQRGRHWGSVVVAASKPTVGH